MQSTLGQNAEKNIGFCEGPIRRSLAAQNQFDGDFQFFYTDLLVT